jgi:hypothetical protein
VYANPVNLTDPTGFDSSWIFLNATTAVRPGGLYRKGELLAPMSWRCPVDETCFTTAQHWIYPIFDPTLGGDDLTFLVPNPDAGRRGGAASNLVAPKYLEYSALQYAGLNVCYESASVIEQPTNTGEWINIGSHVTRSDKFGRGWAQDILMGMATVGSESIGPAPTLYLSDPRVYREIDKIAKSRGSNRATGLQDTIRTYADIPQSVNTQGAGLEVLLWIDAAQKLHYRDIYVIVQKHTQKAYTYRVVVKTKATLSSGQLSYLTVTPDGRLNEIPDKVSTSLDYSGTSYP